VQNEIKTIESLIHMMDSCEFHSYQWYGHLNHATQLNNSMAIRQSSHLFMMIDDERFPATFGNFFIVRNQMQLERFLKEFGFPQFISFDHDLGKHETITNLLNMLTDKLIEMNKVPDGFDYYIHSQNPIGRDKLESFMHDLIAGKYFN
jgi:hypothetical protein